MINVQLVHADTITLNPGLNLVGIPISSNETPDTFSLIQQLGTQSTIEALQSLTSGNFDATGFSGSGIPVGTNVNVNESDGWLVFAKTVSTITVDPQTTCPDLNLQAGLNIVGMPCEPISNSAYGLLQAIGDASVVTAVQTFDSTTGRFLTAAYDNSGLPTGPDFTIQAYQAYLVHMLLPANPDIYVAALTCNLVDPQLGPTGSSTSILGSGFIPGISSVTINGISASVLSTTATQIDVQIPTGFTTGPVVIEQRPGGNTITCGNFTVNNGPAFDTIGNQTAALGQTIEFAVTATDADGDDLTYSIMNAPLPLGASFDAATQSFTFSPTSLQAGSTFEIIFEVTDGNTIVTQSILIDVPAPLATDTTNLQGQVLTLDSQPLAGVRLVIGVETPVETFSQADGSFSFTDIPVFGKQRLLIDGSTVPSAPVGTYATVPESITLQEKASNTLDAPIFLLPLDIASADPVVFDAQSTITSSPVESGGLMYPAVEMIIPPSSAKLEDGTPFNGNISISTIPAPDLGPMPLPDDFDLSVYIAIQPFGVKYDTPADIAFPNVEGFPVDSIVDIVGLNHDTGRMEKVGDGIVEADGMVRSGTVNADGSFTRHGVVRENSWHGFVPQRLLDFLDNLFNRFECFSGSTTCGKTGDMSVAHDLVQYRSLGVARGLSLEYHSQHAHPYPVLSRFWTPGNATPPPIKMSARARIGGFLKERISFAPQFCTGFSCPPARFPYAFDARTYATGVYPSELELSCQFPVSRRDNLFRDKIPIVNKINSSFGSGWSISGLERIHRAVTGDLLLDDGRLEPLVFSPAKRARAEIIAAGERDNYQVVLNKDQTISLLMKRRSNQPDGSSTLDPFINVYDSRGFLLVTDDDTGVSTIAGPGNDAEIKSFAAPTTDTYTIEVRGAGGTSGLYDLFLTTASETAFVEGELNTPDTVVTAFVFNADIATFGELDEHPFVASAGTKVTIEVNREINAGDGTGSLDPVVELQDSRGFVIATDDDSGTNLPPGPGRNALILNTILPATDTYKIVVKGASSTTGPYQINVSFGDFSGNINFAGGAAVTIDTVMITPPKDFSELTENPDGTFTRRMTDGTVKQFDVNGLLVSVTDRNSNAETYLYDTAERLTTITDPVGKITTLNYFSDACGNLKEVIDPALRVTQLNYDSSCNLIFITDPDNSQRRFSYDGNHLLTQQTGPRGIKTPSSVDFVTKYEYDFSGRFIQSTLPDNVSRQMEASQRIGLVEPPKLSICSSLVTDPVGCPINPAPPIPQADVDVTFTDAEGRTTAFEASGTVEKTTKISDPLGRTTTIVKDVNENLKQLVLPSNHTFNLGYDSKGNLTSHFDSILAATNTFIYEPQFNQVESVKDAQGNTTLLTYDAIGNLIDSASPEGRTASYTYNAQGQVVTETRPGEFPIQYEYDLDGNPTVVRQGTGVDERVTQLTYSAAGNIASIIDPLSRTSTFEYDPVDRVTKQTLPNSRIISFGYDEGGNLTSLRPPEKPDHQFVYNLRDAEVEYEPPTVSGDPRTLLAYNNEQQLLALQRPDAQTIAVDYNFAGETNTVTTPDSTYQFTYQSTTGLVSSITAPGVVANGFSYTGSIPTNTSWSGDVSGNVGWTFNSLGQLTSRSVNAANTIVFEYDRDGLLTKAGDLFVTPDLLTGLITSTQLGLVDTQFTYSGFSELASDQTTFDDNEIFANTYTRDKLGRIESKQETIEGVTTTYNYTYDDADRLHQVTQNGTLVSTYTYDKNGNRLSFTDTTGVINGDYDNQDRLLTYGDFSYTYTENGELTSKTNTSTLETTLYNYDVFGNLKSVTLPNSTVVNYQIDTSNRRVGKLVNGVFSRALLYGDQLNPIAELDSVGDVASRYIYATKPNVPAYMIKQGVVYRVVSDQLGSVRLVVDINDGTVAQRIDYDEFGRVLQDTNPGFQPFGYAGGIYDMDTGLVRFGARDYDSEIGRWLSKDNSRFSGGDTNLYAYVQNDPINFIDPTGRVLQYVVAFVAGAAIDIAIQVITNPGGKIDLCRAGVAGLIGAATFGIGQFVKAGKLRSLFRKNPGATKGVKALPAPRQIDAKWSINKYRHGGEMSAIEHINYRHAFHSGFSNVGKFSKSTSVRNIRTYVDNALRYGKVNKNGVNGFTVEYNVGRTIGRNSSGTATSKIRVHIRDGNIQTAFPF